MSCIKNERIKIIMYKNERIKNEIIKNERIKNKFSMKNNYYLLLMSTFLKKIVYDVQLIKNKFIS